jgi:hypothetical protein
MNSACSFFLQMQDSNLTYRPFGVCHYKNKGNHTIEPVNITSKLQQPCNTTDLAGCGLVPFATVFCLKG